MQYSLKSRKEGGLGELDVPLLSDVNKKIASDYQCLITEGNDSGLAFRASYIIDRKGIVRHTSINDLPVGRNCDQYLRLVKAFIYTDEHNEVCQANWQPGQKAINLKPQPNLKNSIQKKSNTLSDAHIMILHRSIVSCLSIITKKSYKIMYFIINKMYNVDIIII